MSNEHPATSQVDSQQAVGDGGRPAEAKRAGLIVVPLDGSREAKDALPAAKLAARIAGAHVLVVQAVERELPALELLQCMGLRPEETQGFIVDQIVGPAAEAIVSLARDRNAILIAMTTRGRTAYQGRTVRPVVETVIQNAPCPVLLVRPEIDQKVASMTGVRRMLLPLDGAPSSAAVIGPALDLAERSHAEVDVLYVATRAARPAEPGALAAPLYVDQPQYEWPSWAREFVTRFGTCLGQRPLPTPTRFFLRHGDPATEILDLARARDADLIVLEWRGKLDPRHASVVKGVLSDAPCPVLLIQTGQS